MIWLALRRRRTALAVFFGTALLLDAWMVVNGHTSANALRHTGTCQSFPCVQPSELYAPAHQAVVVDLLLVLLPLVLGLVFGVGLVAGDSRTGRHRLVWTQEVSRTRWYLTSLGVAVIGALLVTVVELPVAHWWAGVAWVDLPNQVTLGGDRIQPVAFPVSGVVPLAYACFAVALGTGAGAVLRRVPWAAAVTVIAYLALSVVMVTTVRASFAPTGFFMDDTTNSAQYVNWPHPPPWVISYEFRTIPGGGRAKQVASPNHVAAACSAYGYDPGRQIACLDRLGVEGGFVTQSPAHYWRLQWAEALIYLGMAVVLAGVGLVAVRRMQD